MVWVLTEVAGWHYMGSVVFAVMTTWVINFTANKLWTFRVRNQATPSSTPVLATDGWRTGACWKPAAVPTETYHPV